MKLTRKKLLLSGILALSISAFAEGPKYIFYFIGDGMGAAQRQISEEYKKGVMNKDGKLLMNSLPFSAITTTYSADTLITDSAAAGTALATGHKTNNGVIAKTPKGENLKTLLELLKNREEQQGL